MRIILSSVSVANWLPLWKELCYVLFIIYISICNIVIVVYGRLRACHNKISLLFPNLVSRTAFYFWLYPILVIVGSTAFLKLDITLCFLWLLLPVDKGHR